jgi:hypothetical protein
MITVFLLPGEIGASEYLLGMPIRFSEIDLQKERPAATKDCALLAVSHKSE